MKAKKLILKVKAALEAVASYSDGGLTWEVDGNKLSQHRDSDGSWRSVQKGALMDHVAYIARTCADWSEDAEGEVIDSLRNDYGQLNVA